MALRVAEIQLRGYSFMKDIWEKGADQKSLGTGAHGWGSPPLSQFSPRQNPSKYMYLYIIPYQNKLTPSPAVQVQVIVAGCIVEQDLIDI